MGAAGSCGSGKYPTKTTINLFNHAFVNPFFSNQTGKEVADQIPSFKIVLVGELTSSGELLLCLADMEFHLT
jgi:hypothetical protein